MMRQLRAFAWMRWRLMVNGLRGARKRDTLEQISRILTLVGPALLVAMSLGSVIGLAIAGVFAGIALAQDAPGREAIVFIIRLLGVLMLVVVAFMPLSLGAASGATRYARLLLLPIPRRLLHMVEVASGVADPWIFIPIPGLLLVAVGLAIGGALGSAVLAVVAGLGLLAAFLAFGVLSGFVVSWLMRDRRRAEMSTLIFVVGLSLVGLLPQLFGMNASSRSRRESGESRERSRPAVERVEQALPVWTRALPTEMYGRALLKGVVQQDRAAGLAWTGGLWLQAGFIYWLSSLVHARLLLSVDGRARRTGPILFRALPRVPLLTAGAAAVAMVQFRTGFRSLRGRLAVLLPGPMLALLSVVLSRSPEEAAWIARIPEHGYFIFGASLILALLTVHPITLNQFASDRAGLTLQWLSPLSARDLVFGKAVGGFMVYGSGALLALAVIGAMTRSGTPVLWVATAFGGIATYAVFSPYAALMSALFPVAADLNKNGSAGNPHTAAVIPGVLLTPLAALPAVGIMLLSLRWSPWVSLAAMAVWAAVALGLAWWAVGLTAGALHRRRENLFLTASQQKR
jgi:hypothetical protein